MQRAFFRALRDFFRYFDTEWLVLTVSAMNNRTCMTLRANSFSPVAPCRRNNKIWEKKKEKQDDKHLFLFTSNFFRPSAFVQNTFKFVLLSIERICTFCLETIRSWQLLYIDSNCCERKKHELLGGTVNSRRLFPLRVPFVPDQKLLANDCDLQLREITEILLFVSQGNHRNAFHFYNYSPTEAISRPREISEICNWGSRIFRTQRRACKFISNIVYIRIYSSTKRDSTTDHRYARCNSRLVLQKHDWNAMKTVGYL